MLALLDVGANEVFVTSLNEPLLTLLECLHHVFIRLLFIHDHLLALLVLTLLSLFDLQSVVFSELAQLLLQHGLMVPCLDVLFYLLLGPLQFDHDLLVTHLHSLVVVSLSLKIELVVLSLFFLELIPSVETLLVDLSQSDGLCLVFVLGCLDLVLEVDLLADSVLHQSVISVRVAVLHRLDSIVEEVSMLVTSRVDLFIH